MVRLDQENEGEVTPTALMTRGAVRLGAVGWVPSQGVRQGLRWSTSSLSPIWMVTVCRDLRRTAYGPS